MTIKPWGKTRCILMTDTIEVWHASINLGGMSSMHRHLLKANDFWVISGILKIALPGRLKGEQILSQGMPRFTVPAGEWHQFEALTEVELIETYHIATIDPGDIERMPENTVSMEASNHVERDSV